MRKCPHGVFWPDGQEKALYCTFCNPSGNPDAKVIPEFNRRGALHLTETGRLPKCPTCHTALLAVSNGGRCVVCKTEHEIVAPHKLRANNKQPGLCPSCGSGVHIEIDGRTWKCADCATPFKASKELMKRLG
ncbi:Uncharacterised protein [uncultured archaeon]|nr:Uncharacterised protein [uncultured archaeon]